MDRHAVVIGASMAGLLTARVLADHVAQVTLVERDDLPEGPVPRKGVPQGRHAHGLLPSGERVLDDLFPGLVDDLVAAGAQRVTTTTGRWWQGGGYKIAAPSAPDATFFSRPFLERGVRARVEALPNVVFRQAGVVGLAGDAGRVRGVVLGAETVQATLCADLVVDCSGRGSQASHWLEELGYKPPDVSQVHIDMCYATRVYRRTPGRLPEGTWFVTISDPPEHKRFGVAFPIEGGRWIVTLGGCHGDRPPTDDCGLLAFAESLPTADIADILENEAPVSPPVTHRLPSNQWRHFERLQSHPAGFVALGDSICSFNPVYGQGMSSAAQQANALRSCLGGVEPNAPELWRAFYRQAKKVIANPWAIAAGADFVYPETTGPKPPGTDIINRYVAKVIVAAQHDVKVAEALWDVQGLLAPPPSLMKPAMLTRVLRVARRGPVGHPLSMTDPERMSATSLS